MYLRARGYCLHGLELRHSELTLKSLAADPNAALRATTKDDVPWLYWTAASWGAELSLAPPASQLMRIPELASVRALLNRAKALDDTWESGAIYEALIAFDGLPPLLGGSRGNGARRLRQGDGTDGKEIGLCLRGAGVHDGERGREAAAARRSRGDRRRVDHDAAADQPDRSAICEGDVERRSLRDTARPLTLS